MASFEILIQREQIYYEALNETSVQNWITLRVNTKIPK